MKKNLAIPGSVILSVLLLFSGCQKEVKEQTVNSEIEDQFKQDHEGDKNECRLVLLDWSAGGAGLWQFHYNKKGLADQWTIDYGDGVIEEKIYYDKNNRLIKADENYYGSGYVYRFYYTGRRLTRATRTSVDFPDDANDFTYTYNRKGQNIRQDDVKSDIHVLMDYDAMGNCTRTDLYFGSDLYYSDNYTFEKPIKNPLLNVPGIETGFLSYGGTYMGNKRWFTSNRTVIYDNGVPFVFNDYDPSKTIPITDRHNLPVSVNYYDRISETSFDIVFDYDNCGGKTGQQDHRSFQGNMNKQANRSILQIHPVLFWGSLKSIKEQIQKFRQQKK